MTGIAIILGSTRPWRAEQWMLSLFTDFESFSSFKPAAMHEQSVNKMPDQVVAWSQALASVRGAG
jgi:hypothetical protein